MNRIILLILGISFYLAESAFGAARGGHNVFGASPDPFGGGSWGTGPVAAAAGYRVAPAPDPLEKRVPVFNTQAFYPERPAPTEAIKIELTELFAPLSDVIDDTTLAAAAAAQLCGRGLWPIAAFPHIITAEDYARAKDNNVKSMPPLLAGWSITGINVIGDIIEEKGHVFQTGSFVLPILTVEGPSIEGRPGVRMLSIGSQNQSYMNMLILFFAIANGFDFNKTQRAVAEHLLLTMPNRKHLEVLLTSVGLNPDVDKCLEPFEGLEVEAIANKQRILRHKFINTVVLPMDAVLMKGKPWDVVAGIGWGGALMGSLVRARTMLGGDGARQVENTYVRTFGLASETPFTLLAGRILNGYDFRSFSGDADMPIPHPTAAELKRLKYQSFHAKGHCQLSLSPVGDRNVVPSNTAIVAALNPAKPKPRPQELMGMFVDVAGSTSEDSDEEEDVRAASAGMPSPKKSAGGAGALPSPIRPGSSFGGGGAAAGASARKINGGAGNATEDGAFEMKAMGASASAASGGGGEADHAVDSRDRGGEGSSGLTVRELWKRVTAPIGLAGVVDPLADKVVGYVPGAHLAEKLSNSVLAAVSGTPTPRAREAELPADMPNLDQEAVKAMLELLKRLHSIDNFVPPLMEALHHRRMEEAARAKALAERDAEAERAAAAAAEAQSKRRTNPLWAAGF